MGAAAGAFAVLGSSLPRLRSHKASSEGSITAAAIGPHAEVAFSGVPVEDTGIARTWGGAEVSFGSRRLGDGDIGVTITSFFSAAGAAGATGGAEALADSSGPVDGIATRSRRVVGWRIRDA